MDADRIRLKNLESLIKDKGVSASKFADMIGMSASQLSQIRNPKYERGVSKNLARKLEGIFDKPHGWMDVTHVSEPQGLYNVEPGPDLPVRKVPVISWVQAGHAAEVIDNFTPGDAEEWVIPHHEPREHTYALRISGDSMAPMFTPGMILVVEPTMCADPGDYVIAKNGDDEATFKQYIKDGGRLFLKPINPQYPIMEMGTFEIIGVVRDAIMKLK